MDAIIRQVIRRSQQTLRAGARSTLSRLGLALALALSAMLVTTVLPWAPQAAARDFDFRSPGPVDRVGVGHRRAFLPDLRITSLSAHYVGYFDSQDIYEVSATVSNDGRSPAGPFTVQFRSGCTAWIVFDTADVSFDDLDAGASRPMSVRLGRPNRTGSIPGHDVRADVYKQVRESNESNNTSGLLIC